MNRIQRRLLRDTCLLGVSLSLLVAVLDCSTRAFAPLEDWFYDRRAHLCQRFTPPPTDKLLHVDIDDQALATIGQWPWPRTVLAGIIEEIDRAGAKAIATDIIFSEPSNPSPRIEESAPGRFIKIDDDQSLAAAFAASGKALVPVSLAIDPAPSPLQHKIREYLTADLELGESQIQQRLLAEGGGLLAPGAAFPMNDFLIARRDAMNLRIARELEKADVSLAELRRRLLPGIDPDLARAPLVRILAEQRLKVQAVAALRRFALPLNPSLPPLARYTGELAPIPPFSRAAAWSGFVDYVQTNERGVVRAVPLFCEHRGRLFPQMDLALACAVLDVDLHTLRIHGDRIIIPRPPGRDRDIVIPVRSVYATTFGRDVGLMMDIPVRGRRAWETIYDHRRHTRPELHLPIAFIWEATSIRERIARNNGNIDRALRVILDEDPPRASPDLPRLGLDPDAWKRYAAAARAPDDFAPRQAQTAATLALMKDFGYDRPLRDEDLPRLPGSNQPDPREKVKRDEIAAASAALRNALEQNQRFLADLAQRRADMAAKVAGRAVIIGWAGTGRVDFFPTAIQSECPGAVLHGLVYNAIMTGEFWRHPPRWVTFIVTLAIGLAVTGANALLRPSGAFLFAAGLGIVYLLVNGLLLFDYANLCLGVAGPLLALGAVWSTGALAGFLIEAAERRHITRRFSTYVDRKLVDYILEKPDARLDGQVREMSVIFTDLAGFTSMAESLRERTVPVLSQYLSAMVPIIRRHDGFVNKFLGDGIMCFFNAPYDDPNHAEAAVAASLEMQRAMRAFAGQLADQGLPRLTMRCGISSGEMVVGDSGPADASDYTVLGDNVNLASRLESANKATGTDILISSRTAELLAGKYLLRPIGRLQVVGKSQSVMTYQPLAPIQDATAAQQRLCEATAGLIEAYGAREFARCIQLADQLDQELGASRLTALYRDASRIWLQNPPAPAFDGALILTEK